MHEYDHLNKTSISVKYECTSYVFDNLRHLFQLESIDEKVIDNILHDISKDDDLIQQLLDILNHQHLTNMPYKDRTMVIFDVIANYQNTNPSTFSQTVHGGTKYFLPLTSMDDMGANKLTMTRLSTGTPGIKEKKKKRLLSKSCVIM